MKLYLVQHGEAKHEAEDPQRSLTTKGEGEVKIVANIAKQMGLNPSNIYHSGKLRAEQTAEIIGEALDKQVEASQGLAPMDEVQLWADKINQSDTDLMLVGHLPYMEKLTSYLITGDEGIRPVLFRNGAINCLAQKENKQWAIRWILTPEMAQAPPILMYQGESERYKCYDSKPDNCHIYNMPTEPCWFCYVPWGDGQASLRSSRVILISKLTGKILYDGSAGDEG